MCYTITKFSVFQRCCELQRASRRDPAIKRFIEAEKRRATASGDLRRITPIKYMPRPSKDDYYLNIALEISRRGTCLRRNFGAVIVNNDEIVSTGYSGAPRGARNCLDIGACKRQELKIPSGERYELCRSVHAEANAIISASRDRMLDGKIYLAGVDSENEGKLAEAIPCRMCKRMVINAGITEIIVRAADGGIKKYSAEEFLKEDPPPAFMF